ncbi:TRAP transporter small permease subunit [Hydrogenovibrio kuenenii]|uniref:TRAP transporter small permease subunit n=1 Tax=Hydrogenovibrio kuenenii TaxID=63658 RepID=UPI000463E0B4|nr:TRAP transporter small permease subunit [Hydrogenovibrio kuenenii]
MNAFISSLNLWLSKFVHYQDRAQQTLGHIIAWGLLSLVVIAASVVILRYGFNSGSIALQEVVIYNHAIVFMLGMAYTLQQNKHVRVDVFYTNFSPKRKAWIDLLGGLFLALPTLAFILWSSWNYVLLSWKIKEASAEAGGLDYVYLLKTVIWVMAILLIFQVLSMIARSYLTLVNGDTNDESVQDHVEGKV